jgi:hypothetical protein
MFKRRRRSFGGGGSFGTPSRSLQKSRRTLRPTVALGVLLLALIGAELLARAVVSLRGQEQAARIYQGEPPEITAYRLQFVDQNRQAYDGLPQRGQMMATRSPLMGYRLMPSQQNSFWTINEQGFRASESVPQAKPSGEIRIFVLGGSTAFGQLSPNDQALFTTRLQTLLNDRVALQQGQPDSFQPAVLPYRRDLTDQALARPARIPEGNYRVINAAVPGYTSGNELGQLTHEILAYQPDLVILLHGYPDLLLPSQQEAAEVPGIEPLLTHSGRHLSAHVSQQFRALLGQLYLVKGFQYMVLQPRQKPDSIHLVTQGEASDLQAELASDPAELEQRARRYRQNLQEIARITASADIPLVVAIQPEITGRQSLTAEETEILEALGDRYPEQVQQGYAALATSASEVKNQFPQTMRALNLYAFFNTTPENEAAFISPIHLTESANQLLANRLYQAVVETTAIEPVPFAQAAGR